MLRAYEQGTVPTFASMQLAVNEVTSYLESEKEDSEIGPLLKLLSQRVKEIRRNCSAYEQTVITFHRKKKERDLVGNASGWQELEKADVERRRIHENLMTSIRSLDETIHKLGELESLPKTILRWEVGQVVPEHFAHEHPVIFNATVATNTHRDFIKDWSIVANLEQKMEAQRAYFQTEDSK